ncbi:S1 family peptidase [Nocardia sp. CDC159]|uniref:S1 family peptidase n=1 Tax=Nocardia pulmonis TaxID=2951408 RepID=A0A9X2J259_9NOCA|nr:S1 family peptidase [Nocardia pulmonis]MCM6790510.1 S1 family peptidase [Nocardia sp. CDC159]
MSSGRLPNFLIILAAVLAMATAGPPEARAAMGIAAPGMALNTDDKRCSLGLSGHIGDIQYGVTAGHCFQGGKAVFAHDGFRMGVYEQGFGSDDTVEQLGFALVRYEPNVAAAATLPDRLTITSAEAVPAVGEEVCHIGSTTGTTCGPVTAVQNGYFVADFPSEKGDSGGIVYRRGGPGAADFLGILIGTKEGGGIVVESASYLRDTISAHTGGRFEWRLPPVP